MALAVGFESWPIPRGTQSQEGGLPYEAHPKVFCQPDAQSHTVGAVRRTTIIDMMPIPGQAQSNAGAMILAWALASHVGCPP